MIGTRRSKRVICDNEEYGAEDDEKITTIETTKEQKKSNEEEQEDGQRSRLSTNLVSNETNNN